MRTVALAVVLGVLWVQRQSALAGATGWLVLAGCAGLSCWVLVSPRYPGLRRLLAVLTLLTLAVAYTLAVANQRLSTRLPAAWDGERVRAVGLIVGLPESTPTGQRFLFQPESLVGVSGPIPKGLLLRVSCRGSLVPQPSERWELWLKLRAPRGLINPGTFDYEAWLFAQGLGGLASCRDHPGNRALPGQQAQGLDAWRARQLMALRAALNNDAPSAVVAALSLGDDSGLDATAWEVLRATGTIHLISVSGLHVSCVALSITWMLDRFVPWGWFGRWARWRRVLAELTGLSAAAAYAALAGFAVPVQRALIMLTVYSLANLSGWPFAPTQVLASALIVVLAVDPLAVLGQGFWLSFLAVAVLIVVGHMAVRARTWWQVLLRPQLAMGFALAPVMFAWGLGLAPMGLVVNLIAIPWVTLITTPAALGGVLLQSTGWLTGASIGWQLAWASLLPLWVAMTWLAEVSWIWQPALTRPEATALAALASVLALWPQGLGLRLPAWLATIGLFVSPPPRWAPGEFALTALDVGQGTAVTIETATHTLVYDTGPHFSERFEAGGAIVAPYLQARGRVSVDTLVVSHADGDHAGGVPGLLAAMPVQRLLTSDLKSWSGPPAEACRAGQHWNWDGVQFQVLHPEGWRRWSDNDGSCVLRVASAYGSALLPGDIEAGAESALLARPGALTPTDVVIAPHHGSKTSSTPAFIRALQASHVVFTVGHQNRYGLPQAQVQARWTFSGTSASDSARHGAVEFEFLRRGLLSRQTRTTDAPYWRWQE